VQYNQLGQSGIAVSRVALATSEFGTTVDEPTARQLLDVFAASGGTLIDAADVYADGTCEVWLGRWLHDHPELDRALYCSPKAGLPSAVSPAPLSVPATCATPSTPACAA
jgi:aryl-alcohol dehydrogenase-like predicted oxidoreductase